MSSASQARRLGLVTAIGATSLILGAVAIDAGRLLDNEVVARCGYVLTALAGLGLPFLPMALKAWLPPRPRRWFGSGAAAYVVGAVTASLVDVPTIFDPHDTRLGAALGLPALILLSVGLLIMRHAAAMDLVEAPTLRRLLLIAGLWLFVQLPINIAFVVVPTGEPSFVLLAGGVGTLLAAIGLRLGTPAPRAALPTSTATIGYGDLMAGAGQGGPR